jgi:hypothetical protein
MTPLEAELQRWALRERQQQQRARGHGLNVRAYRQFFPDKAAAAKETRKVETGIRLNSNGTVTVHGTTYTRDEFRGALEANTKAQRDDPKSAYRNARDPNHNRAVEEINLAYKFLNNELSPQDEQQAVQEWQDATQESGEVANPQPYQQIAEMWKDPAVRAAKQRRDGGAPLDDRQKEIMREYDRLETANNVQAYRERAVKSGTKGPRPYIPSDAMAWISNPHKEQRRQLAAEWKAKTLADPTSDYWHADRGARHKSAMLAMKAAYEAAETGEVNSVQINPADGTVSGEE